MIRQEDIAKKLNVSRASVSRALNGGKLNERTRKKILDTAKEMGYIQNNAATSLASKKNIVVQEIGGASHLVNKLLNILAI